MPDNDGPVPVPGLGAYMAADTPDGKPRLGKVTAWDGEVVHLRQPGGGAAWTAPPSALRRPTGEERALIRILTTPVPDAAWDLPPAVPVPGCPTCGLAAAWERHSLRAHDHSRAADFRVELRNHPHERPKVTFPAEGP